MRYASYMEIWKMFLLPQMEMNLQLNNTFSARVEGQIHV